MPVVVMDAPPRVEGETRTASPDGTCPSSPALPLTFTIALPNKPSWEELLGLR
jgi:hypothetical protein